MLECLKMECLTEEEDSFYIKEIIIKVDLLIIKLIIKGEIYKGYQLIINEKEKMN